MILKRIPPTNFGFALSHSPIHFFWSNWSFSISPKSIHYKLYYIYFT